MVFFASGVLCLLYFMCVVFVAYVMFRLWYISHGIFHVVCVACVFFCMWYILFVVYVFVVVFCRWYVLRVVYVACVTMCILYILHVVFLVVVFFDCGICVCGIFCIWYHFHKNGWLRKSCQV